MNRHFINTWVSNSELGRTRSLREPIAKKREREGKPFDTTHPLAQAIMKGWKTGSQKGSPVDSYVISPEFELMGKQQFTELEIAGISQKEYYHTFLKDALEEKQPGLGNIVLTREHLVEEVLDVFRTPAVGYLDYTVVVIDLTSFENGGTLTIDIKIGRDKGDGEFYLFDEDGELSIDEEEPKDALTGTWGEPCDTRQITYRFERGQRFKLGASGYWDEGEMCINAFLAKISVEENPNGTVQ
ncbi:hypothetical protein C6501_11640 [Candidatus Poribacteria bacterium]|nr:MAG: hypothetical protein C6501_11640 [Candidatus Poribacteria bacterium]